MVWAIGLSVLLWDEQAAPSVTWAKIRNAQNPLQSLHPLTLVATDHLFDFAFPALLESRHGFVP